MGWYASFCARSFSAINWRGSSSRQIKPSNCSSANVNAEYLIIQHHKQARWLGVLHAICCESNSGQLSSAQLRLLIPLGSQWDQPLCMNTLQLTSQPIDHADKAHSMSIPSKNKPLQLSTYTQQQQRASCTGLCPGMRLPLACMHAALPHGPAPACSPGWPPVAQGPCFERHFVCCNSPEIPLIPPAWGH